MTKRMYEKYVIENPQPEELAYHGKEMKEAYKVLLSKRLLPEANYYVVIYETSKIPEVNPPVAIHAHDVDQFAIYIGEKGSFKITYALIPPGKDTIDEFTAHKEDEYTITSTGCVFIPKGVKHNLRFDSVDKPVIEISVLMKGSYP